MFKMILIKKLSLMIVAVGTVAINAVIVSLILFSPAANANLPDFTQLVEQHSAAVVNISTKHRTISNRKPLALNNERGKILGELERFLDKDGRGFAPEGATNSLGSGFIISKDGYVVTNYHVIAQADEVIVRLNDRRELVAKLVGVDKRSDIALLKVEASNLPILEMGSSENLKAGEWVIAIGSPFGFDHSVTAGIVSAKGRRLPSENYVPYIQTDVAINPGNSGGPLFNLKGQVVGINSRIFSRTGGFMGVSFAIPIDVAQDVIEQLKTTGKVSRSWLGVYIQEMTRDLALSFGLETPMGALIANVINAGPAKGILKQGDIVLEFDGKPIENSSALPVIVGSTAPNKTVDVKIMRGGKTEILRMKIGELPSEGEVKQAPKKVETSKKSNELLGMELVNLNDDTKKFLNVEKGVLVKSVKADPAKKAGIESGDVIMMFKGQHINDLAELNALSENMIEGTSYAALVLRAGSARFLVLKAGKRALNK